MQGGLPEIDRPDGRADRIGKGWADRDESDGGGQGEPERKSASSSTRDSHIDLLSSTDRPETSMVPAARGQRTGGYRRPSLTGKVRAAHSSVASGAHPPRRLF